jgi:hypothetical protein
MPRSYYFFIIIFAFVAISCVIGFTILLERETKLDAHLNSEMTSSDISKLSDEEKAMIDDYLKNNNTPITYAQFENEIEKRRVATLNKTIVESQVSALKSSQ